MFADDNTIISELPEANQVMLTKSTEWLEWTRTSKAKPSKCRAIAFKRFDLRAKNPGKYKKLQDKQYSAYDPLLEISGRAVPCMWHEEFVMKYLGRLFQADLNDDQIRALIIKKFEQLMTAVDKSLLTGMMKVWIYDHAVASKMSWVLMIHDLPPSWVEFNLQRTTTRMLKKWTHLAQPANVNIFFRSKEHYGLHLKHMTEFSKRLQVMRQHLIKHSSDERIVTIYNAKRAHHANDKKDLRAAWRSTIALENAESAVTTQQIVGNINVGRQGLGFGKRASAHVDNDPRREHRKLVLGQVEAEAEIKRFAEEADHVVQGSWQKWEEAQAADTSWHRLLYQMSPDLVTFWMNSTMDTCPTPANLERWKLVNLGQCNLCGNRSGNLQHILNVCGKALSDGRFTWRHDSVLSIVQQIAQIAVNRGQAIARKGGRKLNEAIRFVKAGETQTARTKLVTRPTTMLEKATDWQLKFDLNYDENGTKRGTFFPETVLVTGKLPDGIIWSESTKIIYLLELSCSWEERHVEAHCRKMKRYADIESQLTVLTWTVHHLPFEIGSRGYNSPTVNVMLKSLGLNSAERKSARNRMAETALLCSYMIYIRQSG